MEEIFIKKTIAFLSDHFELLVYINGSLAALFLLIFIAVKFSDANTRRAFRATVSGVLYLIIITGQISFFTVLGYLYWKNYQAPASTLELADNVISTTRWVNNDLKVYFIDGISLRSIKINGQDLDRT